MKDLEWTGSKESLGIKMGTMRRAPGMEAQEVTASELCVVS